MKTNSIFNDDTLVEIRVMNKVAEIKKTSWHKRNIVRINNVPVDADTGEILSHKYDEFEMPATKDNNDRAFQTAENDASHKKKTRLSNPKALSYTRKHNKNLIISNYNGNDKFSFITLRYDNSKPELDEVKLNMNALIKKIKRNYTTEDNKFKYLYTIEKNYAGFFHVHLLLFWDSFVPDKFLADKNKLWKFGMLHYSDPFTDDYKITYLAAYVTYGMCNSSEFINKYIIPETREEKKAVKHARLDCFGEYKRIFFHSEGMTEAKPVVMTYAEAKEKFGFNDETVFYSNSFTKDISTETTIHQNYEYHCVS